MWADVRQFLTDPGATLARVREQQESGEATAELEERRADLNKRLAATQEERARVLDAFTKGMLDESELDASSKALHRRPQVQLQRPGRRVLRVELPVSLGDGVGSEHGVILAVGGHLAHHGSIDLAVYDDVRDVYAPRPELPRHGLGQCAQTKLADGERREVRLAAQCRRGSGEKDSATSGFDHSR